ATMPFRTPGYEWVCRADWQRIAEDLQFRELRIPERSHLIAPSRGEALEWIKWTRSEAEKSAHYGHYDVDSFSLNLNPRRLQCSLDVETPMRAQYEQRQEASQSKAETLKCKACGHTRRWHDEEARRPDGTPDPVCRGIRKKGCAVCCEGFVAP